MQDRGKFKDSLGSLRLAHTPFLQALRDLVGHQPMSACSQSALRAVGRAHSTKMPDLTGNQAIGKQVAFSPPAIPELFQIEVRPLLRTSQFFGQESPGAEQPSLGLEDARTRLAGE